VDSPASQHSAREQCRAESGTGAFGFAARLAAGHHFAGFGIHQTVIEDNHGFVRSLVSTCRAATACGKDATARADAPVIPAEHNDVAQQSKVGAANLADARAGSLLYAIAGREILLLHDVLNFAALNHGIFAVLRDALHHHGLDALADV